MIIYLSGPITNVVDYKQKFAEAEETMKKRIPCAKIINPAKVVLPSNAEYDDYMNIDFMLLDLADMICMLPGWECSKGACMEYGYAKARDLIFFEMDS